MTTDERNEFILPKAPPDEDSTTVRARLGRAFEEVRGVDTLGCQAIIEHDADMLALVDQWDRRDRAQLWPAILSRFSWLAAKGPCLKCGTCCRTASPTLYEGDRALIDDGHIPRSALYSLRSGEYVYSPRLKDAEPVKEDLVKIREASGGLCTFLEDSLCTIHGHHPLQCRHLQCWAGKHAGQLSKKPRLNRRGLYAGDAKALQLIDEYDVKVPAASFAEDLRGAESGDRDASRRALELIELDQKLRVAIAEKLGYAQEEQDLLLGREALLVASVHGLVVTVNERKEVVLEKAQQQDHIENVS